MKYRRSRRFKAYLSFETIARAVDRIAWEDNRWTISDETRRLWEKGASMACGPQKKPKPRPRPKPSGY